jgi:nitrate reductase gamma subunit
MAYDVEKLDPRNDWIIVSLLLVVVACGVVTWRLNRYTAYSVRKDLDILVRRVERLEAVPK